MIAGRHFTAGMVLGLNVATLEEERLPWPDRREPRTAHTSSSSAPALGDCRPPGVAAVAKQQGVYVAEVIKARNEGRTLAAPFRYRDFGSLATIGRRRAVAQMGPFKLNGFAAWLLWCVAHIYFLIGFRNRAIVATNWAWNYITFQRGLA